jgi:hypothetical protein
MIVDNKVPKDGFMKFIVFLLALSVSTAAHAFPKAPFNALTQISEFSSLDKNLADYDFEGIVKLSNCSGSIVKFENQPMSSKAIVLTNGHCVPAGIFGGMIKPGEVIVNKAVSRSMKVYDQSKRLVDIKTTRIIYATMTVTDMALYELNTTYSDLAAKNIDAFELVSSRPIVGIDIDIVSGYWDRGYSCGIESFVFKMMEEGYTFADSIRYAPGCNTIGGTSGSPIIQRGTRNVVGVNNTGNESGKQCTMNNPCEIDENGQVTAEKGVSYGQQTYLTYSCLRADFNLDLNLPGCMLAKPKR